MKLLRVSDFNFKSEILSYNLLDENNFIEIEFLEEDIADILNFISGFNNKYIVYDALEKKKEYNDYLKKLKKEYSNNKEAYLSLEDTTKILMLIYCITAIIKEKDNKSINIKFNGIQLYVLIEYLSRVYIGKSDELNQCVARINNINKNNPESDFDLKIRLESELNKLDEIMIFIKDIINVSHMKNLNLFFRNSSYETLDISCKKRYKE